MKYSVLGFNQELVMQTDLDLTDLMLLQYVINACGTPKMKHILDSNERPMVWLQHKKISEDLPILRISEGTLRNRLVKLRQSGYIDSKTIAAENAKGTRTYYGITEMTMSLIYDMKTDTTSFKNDMGEPSRHSKMTSNNLLVIDNKLDSTIPKGIVSDPISAVTEYDSHGYSKEDEKEERKNDTVKQKKLSLFDKCMQVIEECSETEQVKAALRDYLPVRLAMREKQLYGVNQWKGIINKLQTLTGDHEQIVRYTLEHGYASVYDYDQLSKGTQKGQRGYSKPNKSVFGETDTISSPKVSEQEREEIMRNGTKF